MPPAEFRKGGPCGAGCVHRSRFNDESSRDAPQVISFVIATTRHLMGVRIPTDASAGSAARAVSRGAGVRTLPEQRPTRIGTVRGATAETHHCCGGTRGLRFGERKCTGHNDGNRADVLQNSHGTLQLKGRKLGAEILRGMHRTLNRRRLYCSVCYSLLRRNFSVSRAERAVKTRSPPGVLRDSLRRRCSADDDVGLDNALAWRPRAPRSWR